MLMQQHHSLHPLLIEHVYPYYQEESYKIVSIHLLQQTTLKIVYLETSCQIAQDINLSSNMQIIQQLEQTLVMPGQEGFLIFSKLNC